MSYHVRIWVRSWRWDCLTVYPKKYAHGFVVLCFVVVMQSFIMNSHEVFIHIHQGCFAGTGAIVRLPQCQWSKPDGYGKISQCITTTKHSKAKTVCIFLGICMTWFCYQLITKPGNKPVSHSWSDTYDSVRSIWCNFKSAEAHDDVIQGKHFPRYLTFVRRFHRSPVNSPHKGQWCGALVFSLIFTSINRYVNNREAGDLRRHRAHYDVTVLPFY